ncbi:MAG TPA: BTAD domain-containing putative transcriptional regulator [Candidatus Limnocylindrales bacterium]
MRIQLLGPVRVWRDDQLFDLGSGAQRAVLGLLALAVGQPLSRAELIDGVWYDRPPPPSAANVIQTYVKHLRKVLEPDRAPRARSAVLRQVGDGYALNVPPDTVDVVRFRQRLDAATAAQREGRLDRAAELLAEALGLWQGHPMADVGTLVAHPKVVSLAGERHAALGRYGEVMVAAGRAAEVLPALEEAAATQPLDEAAQARLIRAYQAAGRRWQAFEVFHQVRHRLIEELGVEPGPELSSAHITVLQAESRGPRPGLAARAAAAPAQLPVDVPGFVARTTELARLDALLDDSPPAAIAMLSGTAGVGKTALAVRWAHRVADRFPDGQLYANLRGFDATGTLARPAEVVRTFLDALGVPASRIPVELEARTALYRSEMFRRRMLVVLDNARDSAQVRPLLPAGPGCLLVVTSRVQLADLVAIEGARPLALEPLTPADARQLIVRRIGASRVDQESHAVAEIIERCAGLPLALAILAARASTNPMMPLSTLASRLRRVDDRLDTLTTGDPDSDLRAVFSWSYRSLSSSAARLFRLLGLHPGPDIGTAAAASLAARSPAQVRPLLAELCRANLVIERGDGRYSLHDLLRAYASDLVERLDPRPRREAAALRVLDHYLHSAHAANGMLDQDAASVAVARPRPGVAPERPLDRREARAWFTAHHTVLLAAAEQAVVAQWDVHTWQLAAVLGTYLDRGGHWYELAEIQRAAVAAAARVADPSAQAGAHRFLARAYTRLRRFDDAEVHLRHAHELYGRSGDRRGRGDTHLNLALLLERRDRPGEALGHAREALAAFEDDGHRHGQARALNSIGWYHTLRGEYLQALSHCERALAALQEIGDRNGLANTWDSLGYTHHHLGNQAYAGECYRRAIDLYREVGDRHLEAIALSHLGDHCDAIGDVRGAHEAWQKALSIVDGVDQPEAEALRAKVSPALV